MTMSFCETALAAADGNQAAQARLTKMLNERVRPLIVAIDFDGTLCEEAYPLIGAPYEIRLAAVRLLKRRGARVILWTCREGEEAEAAVLWLKAQGVSPDAVNDNLPEIKALFQWNSRKIFADEYWDDKAVSAKEDI